MQSHRYRPGSRVQHKTGYVHIKKQEGGWVAEHRFVAEMLGDATGKSGELKEGEKVYHLDGTKDRNDPRNIIRIQFNTTKFVLAERRILWEPKETANDVMNAALRTGKPTSAQKRAFTNEVLARIRK